MMKVMTYPDRLTDMFHGWNGMLWHCCYFHQISVIAACPIIALLWGNHILVCKNDPWKSDFFRQMTPNLLAITPFYIFTFLWKWENSSERERGGCWCHNIVIFIRSVWLQRIQSFALSSGKQNPKYAEYKMREQTKNSCSRFPWNNPNTYRYNSIFSHSSMFGTKLCWNALSLYCHHF